MSIGWSNTVAAEGTCDKVIPHPDSEGLRVFQNAVDLGNLLNEQWSCRQDLTGIPQPDSEVCTCSTECCGPW